MAVLLVGTLARVLVAIFSQAAGLRHRPWRRLSVSLGSSPRHPAPSQTTFGPVVGRPIVLTPAADRWN
jgi:hypothetical protein